jgi:hypothetical protein
MMVSMVVISTMVTVVVLSFGGSGGQRCRQGQQRRARSSRQPVSHDRSPLEKSLRKGTAPLTPEERTQEMDNASKQSDLSFRQQFVPIAGCP